MKKLVLLGAAAALSAVALAGSANASVTVTTIVQDQLAVNSGALLDDFDGTVHANVAFTGNIEPAVTLPFTVNDSAPPPWSGGVSVCCQGANNYLADPTAYESVQGGTSSTFSATDNHYLTSFSFYIGSPDSYNHVTFHFVGGGSQTLDGADIWGGSPNFGGDRTKGYRVYYNFNGAKVSSITFASDQNAFEADNFGGSLAVPEPAGWALMILGFGGAGAALRRRRTAAVAA